MNSRSLCHYKNCARQWPGRPGLDSVPACAQRTGGVTPVSRYSAWGGCTQCIGPPGVIAKDIDDAIFAAAHAVHCAPKASRPCCLQPMPCSTPRCVQARGRVDQLRRLGHSVDKVEFILMGGTFMSLPPEYRDYFVRSLHDALSGAPRTIWLLPTTQLPGQCFQEPAARVLRFLCAQPARCAVGCASHDMAATCYAASWAAPS